MEEWKIIWNSFCDEVAVSVQKNNLEKVFEEGRAFGKKQVYLTVNKHNDHAIAVYKKTGFKVIDEVVTDIGNGYVMDDYIFGYDL